MRMRCIVRMDVYRKLPSAEVGFVTVWGLARMWNTGRKQNGALKQSCRGKSGTAMGSRWALLHILICIFIHISTACAACFGYGSVTERGMIELWQARI